MAPIRKGFGHVTLKKTQNKTGNASLLFPKNENRVLKSPVSMRKVRVCFFCYAVKIPVVLGEVELNQTANR